MDTQRLQTRIGELAAQVKQLRRASTRQAAPFSKDRPGPIPRRPGRKPDQTYGWRGRRPPVPERVNLVVGVSLPPVCPSSSGDLCVERVACQWQEDLPATQPTDDCHYEATIGRCQVSRRVQPRHPRADLGCVGRGDPTYRSISPN